MKPLTEIKKCSKCNDTLENTQLICWTCHCQIKEKILLEQAQEFEKNELEFLIKANKLLPFSKGLRMIEERIKELTKEVQGEENDSRL